MGFVFPALLGGLALAGVAVIIHLLMRQKPKRVVFPALRFLQEGRKSTTRKLKLRHWLLLALRMLLIGLLVFALARPYFNHPQLGLGGDQPVAAILVMDTTPSMEYAVGGKTRLDDARHRARQLLDELPAGSRVAILDTADQLEEWSPTLDLARSRLDELQIVHARSRTQLANGAVSQQVAAAYRMFSHLRDDEPDQKLTPLLVVFSDRTQACWKPNDVAELKRPEHLGAVFVDVGAETMRDLGITEFTVANDHRIPQQAFLPGQWIYFGVTVAASATGDSAAPVETEVHFRLTSEDKPSVQSVRLAPGNRQTLWFKRRAGLKPPVGEKIEGLPTGLHQAEVRLVPGDDLPNNDVRFASFLVRDSRPVLVVADEASDAAIWKFDAEWFKLFRCEIQETDKVRGWTRDKFDGYSVVCLVNVANPRAADLWTKLADWVDAGGGLVVAPGGEGWAPNLKGYSDDDARKLLPGTFARDEPLKLALGASSVAWDDDYSHDMLSLMREWRKDDQFMFRIEGQVPSVIGYWPLSPDRAENIVIRYADATKTPAILARTVGQGRTVMLTTSFDGKRENVSDRGWTNYNAIYFAPIFETMLLQYLAGEPDDPTFNYLAGEVVPLTFPLGSAELNFTLLGPGLSNAEVAVQRSSVKDSKANIDQAVTPGNYQVVEKGKDQRAQTFAAFSVNPNPEESKLTRVPKEDIEKLLGAGAVVPVKYSDDLMQVLNERWPEPVELLPYVMILVLVVLAAENLFSNLFYKRDDRVFGDAATAKTVAPQNEGEAAPAETPATSPPEVVGHG